MDSEAADLDLLDVAFHGVLLGGFQTPLLFGLLRSGVSDDGAGTNGYYCQAGMKMPAPNWIYMFFASRCIAFSFEDGDSGAPTACRFDVGCIQYSRRNN